MAHHFRTGHNINKKVEQVGASNRIRNVRTLDGTTLILFGDHESTASKVGNEDFRNIVRETAY